MNRRLADRSVFPQTVAWGGLAAGLWLFFSHTMPAVHERRALRAAQDQLLQLRQHLDAALAHARPATPGAGAAAEDLQSVLVAIDRIGWTPAELLAAYPEPPADARAGR
jgi:hypothetical protein